MGQAKQKRLSLERFLNNLSREEKTIFKTSQDLFNNVIKLRNVTGMCYHSTFFLYEYLKEEHCISTTPIIGYINDGTDDVMMSHAWLEYSGTKTDVSLGVTANPILWPTGEVIILDRVIYSGHNYSYHVSMTDAGLQTHYDMLKGPDSALVQQKAEEHLEMLARAKTPQSIRSYLDGAPAGLRYDELSSAIS